MNYLQQIASVRWPLACLLSLALLSGVWRQAVTPGLEEYAELRREAARQRQEARRLQDFAARHSDYEARLAEQAGELAALKSRLRTEGDINAVQETAQRLALANGVTLLEVSSSGVENAAGGAKRQQRLYSLRLQAEGDYHAVLRWLRQLERHGLAADELRLQGEGVSGRVRAGLLLKVYSLENAEGQ